MTSVNPAISCLDGCSTPAAHRQRRQRRLRIARRFTIAAELMAGRMAALILCRVRS